MLTTKNTFLYRVIGVVGALLVLLSVFLPWVTIAEGKLVSFATGSTATGWELVNLPKDFTMDANIVAFLFTFIYILIIAAIIAAALISLGSDGQPAAGMIAFWAVFYTIIIMFLLPVIQGMIAVPPDPYEEVDLVQMRTSMSNEDFQAKVDEMNAQKAQRDKMLEMVEVRFGLQYGLVLCIVGGIMSYLGARLVNSDTEKRIRLEKYRLLLVEAHKDGRITKEVSDLLGQQRRMFGITKDDHDTVLRDIFPEEGEYQIAVKQHLNPVDMDRLIMERKLQEYEVYIIQAYRKGEPSREEAEMLYTIRQTQGITVKDHSMVLNFLIQEGRIPHPDDVRKRRETREKRRKGGKALKPKDLEKKEKSLHDLEPEEVESIDWGEDFSELPRRLPSAGPPKPADHRPPTTKVQPSAAVATAVPVATAPSAPAHTKPVPAKPAPEPEKPLSHVGQGPGPEATPLSKPEPKKVSTRFKCPKCGKPFRIETDKRPVTVKCPSCGQKGTIQ